MADKRLLDVDPFLGIKEYFYYDDDTGECRVEQVQDTTFIIEQNKARLAQSHARDKWKGDQILVATIPMALWADLNQKGIVRDTKEFKKWLNDPANRFFRTREGKV
jgi:hypothetical protein